MNSLIKIAAVIAIMLTGCSYKTADTGTVHAPYGAIDFCNRNPGDVLCLKR